jgi:hypothetical protein
MGARHKELTSGFVLAMAKVELFFRTSKRKQSKKLCFLLLVNIDIKKSY